MHLFKSNARSRSPSPRSNLTHRAFFSFNNKKPSPINTNAPSTPDTATPMPDSDSALTELRALAQIITAGVDQIEQSCSTRNVAFPGLGVPYDVQSESARLDAKVLEASANIVAAAAQITALVRPTGLSLLTMTVQVSVYGAALGRFALLRMSSFFAVVPPSVGVESCGGHECG